MNFADTPAVEVPIEFLAVVLAGYGLDLAPLTSDHGEEPMPKALLPIGNEPMISYTLKWLEQSGIKDVLLICPTSHRATISHYLHSDPSSASFSLKIDIQTYDQSQQLSVGTCALLRHVAHRIDSDFIILPCDFLPPPSLDLSKILNKFRTDSITDGAIATTLFFEHKPPEKEKSGAEDAWLPPSPPSAIVYEEKTGTLLHIDTADDFDTNEEELELRMGMLWHYPRSKLSSNLVDSHIYVCKQSVLDVLAQKPHFDSLREDFIPWLCKVSSQKTKREKYGQVLSSTTNVPPPNTLALSHSTSYVIKKNTNSPRVRKLDATFASRNTSKTSVPATEVSTITAPPSPTGQNYTFEMEASLRCGIVIHKHAQDEIYAARANSIWDYMELNRSSLKGLSPVSHDPAFVDPKSSISADSLLGEFSKLGERSSIKRSVVGRHCVIGKNVKITGSVLMDHCVVEDGAKLEGCLLAKHTRVGSKAELARCITQAGYEVEAGSVYKNEKLEIADWTAQRSGESAQGDGSGTEDDDDSD